MSEKGKCENMQIQAINSGCYNTKINADKLSAAKNCQPLQNNADSVSFCGYSKVLSTVASSMYKNDTEVENAFAKLFKSLKEDKTISKIFPKFDAMDEIYENGGFRGLLNEIWKTNPQEITKNLLKGSETDNVVLASKGEKPVLELVNWGKFGFSQNNPNNVMISFSDGKSRNVVEFCLNKKGDCTISQQNGEAMHYTEYYQSTGNRKFQTYQFSDCMPERTFFNKDGSKAFWKNFFRGGTVPPVW